MTENVPFRHLDRERTDPSRSTSVPPPGVATPFNAATTSSRVSVISVSQPRSGGKVRPLSIKGKGWLTICSIILARSMINMNFC